MKFILLILFTGIISSSVSEKKSELNIVKTLGAGDLYYPAGPMATMSYGSFTVLENKKLILFDSAGLQPFYVIDVEQEELTSFGQWGNGPGVFLRESPKIISLTGEYVYIFDVFSHFLHRFTPDMHYQESILPDIQTSMFGTVLMLNEETLLFSDQGVNRPGVTAEYFFKKYNFDEGQINENYQGILPYESVEELHPVKRNISLKNGPVILYDGIIYLANLFGSVILGIDKLGNQMFYTDLPEQAGIPETEPWFANGVLVGEPEISTLRNLDLAADEHFLYALYSGITIDYENASNFMTGGKLDDDELRMGEAKKIRVYNREDASYLGEFALPEWTAAIAVDDHFLYAVVWDDEPRIVVLEKPEL